MTYRLPAMKRPSAKALSLAAESPLRMAEMAFISSGLSYMEGSVMLYYIVGSRDVGWGGGTAKSGEVAQALSPAALRIAALSIWPEPTRLRIKCQYSPFPVSILGA